MDSQSCIEALSARFNTYGDMMNRLCNFLEQLIVNHVIIKALSMLSHCGLIRNDTVGELARRVIKESCVLSQQGIPITPEAARAIIKLPKTAHTIKATELLEEVRISLRHAEVIPDQLTAKYVYMVVTFHKASDTSRAPVCKMCSHGTKENVDYMLLRRRA